jgi:hypothetical protein
MFGFLGCSFFASWQKLGGKNTLKGKIIIKNMVREERKISAGEEASPPGKATAATSGEKILSEINGGWRDRNRKSHLLKIKIIDTNSQFFPFNR